MRRTPRSLADVREELVQVQEEFTRLQKCIEAVWDCVTDSLVRFFGEQRPGFTGLKEEAVIEGIALLTGEAAQDHPNPKQRIKHVRVF